MSLAQQTETIPLRRDEHGTLRVGATRVTLESIAYLFEDGASPESIAEAFPSLELSDIYLVMGYCMKHPEELQQYLREQRDVIAELRRRDEGRLQPGLRARLLARHAAGQVNGK